MCAPKSEQERRIYRRLVEICFAAENPIDAIVAVAKLHWAFEGRSSPETAGTTQSPGAKQTNGPASR
jgi:hypothetical protein